MFISYGIFQAQSLQVVLWKSCSEKISQISQTLQTFANIVKHSCELYRIPQDVFVVKHTTTVGL